MLFFSYDLETQILKRFYDLAFGRIDRKFRCHRCLYNSFGDKGLYHRRIYLERILPKTFDMKFYR